MKNIELDKIEQLPGRQLKKEDKFYFRCCPEVKCFNLCCRNLNLFLYPYDVIRLKTCLGITSDCFLEKYVDIVLRHGNYFPEVLLSMSENKEKTCPFLTDKGCSVYTDRPDTCRTFPVEHGLKFDSSGRKTEMLHFFKPPDFCLGQYEDQEWSLETWTNDQEAELYNKMTSQWAEVKNLFQNNPWKNEGTEGPRAKMSFMAVYNIDKFREFVFQSSFLKRYKIKNDFKKKIKKSDVQLLKLGFDWIKFYLWGIKPELFKSS
ncbi:Putative zinc- or iron-chelating domain-containing protein [Desulfonema limicola]|uniref:Zinc- or iron-chelating domain-containing protein n=1 Tax=Desulfonema limicola TaxID=45656 RepID=A0A975B629_9BACT|nr:YkgJ family cysteine cluster protein [Desulfonema limicola]QTA79417.1 Putative zinc- or iron-chelating domain-containing protein [Desulfonema limicola]